MLKALALVCTSTESWNEFLDSLLMVHSCQYAEGFGFSVKCVPQHDLGMINHDKFIDSAVALADSVLKALGFCPIRFWKYSAQFLLSQLTYI